MKKAGIIGCGNIAKVHAEVLKTRNDVQLLAFADIRIERAREYAQRYGEEECQYYISLSDMLDKEKLDVVHVCTPHYLHVEMAEYALRKGIDVFMEKPPAITYDEFVFLKMVQQEMGKKVGVCFQNRYNETTLMVERLLKNKKVGRLLGARAFVSWHREKEYYTKSDWRGKKATEGGGVLINQAIHTLDLLVHFLGKHKSVEASLSNYSLKEYIEVEDTVQAYIKFEEVNVCFYATNAYVADAPIIMELTGEKGTIRIEGQTLRICYKNGGSEAYSWDDKQTLGKSYWGSSHESCIADFYKCLDSNRESANDLASTENTFHLVMDIYKESEK